MKWTEVSILTTNEAVEPISNILYDFGAGGIVIEDSADLSEKETSPFGEIYELNPNDYPVEGVRLKAYLPTNSFLWETVEGIKTAINNLLAYDIDVGKNEVTLAEIEEEEWATAWKKYYKPVKISERMTVIPTWEDYSPVSSDEIIIELDPGMAFGTGTHPTTVLSIQALEQYVKEDDIIIDVGSGSGVLSIASALLGAKLVHAYDLDEIAVKSTSLNAQLNKLENKIIAKQNNLLDHIDVKANIIVSNILAEIIIRFVDDAYNCLNDGGLFITSGIIQNKEQLVRYHLQEQGFEIIATNVMEDWVSIVARKPS